MRYIADLHTHSTASDGQYAPGELIRRGKDRGLEVLALTDHDTVAGLDEAVRAGERLEMRVLRGVELSAKEYPNLHILGYGFAEGPSRLTELCREMRERRNKRKYEIIDYLRTKGVDIPLAEVEALASGGVVGRPHFAQVVVNHGYAACNREVFDRWLDTEEFQEINNRFKVDAGTCLEAIKRSGGRASLAHPYQVRLEDEALEELVAQLKEGGLDAIECYYPRHTPEQTAFYQRLAEKYDLHITGGSDFHGEKVKPDIQLAAWELELDWLLDG